MHWSKKNPKHAYKIIQKRSSTILLQKLVKCLLTLILVPKKNSDFFFFSLDQRQRGPIRLVLLVIGWLVGNADFSETALKIFLIFCMKLGDYKGRKVTEPGFWKKIGDICENVSKLAQNQTLWYFSQKRLYFFGFWLEVSTKYDLQFEWKLFFRKICNLEIFDLKIVKKLPNLRFLAIFSTLHH